jgi:hypothetical protein
VLNAPGEISVRSQPRVTNVTAIEGSRIGEEVVKWYQHPRVSFGASTLKRGRWGSDMPGDRLTSPEAANERWFAMHTEKKEE